jgi:hypothetical protein
MQHAEVVTAIRAGNKTRRPYVVRQWGQIKWEDGSSMALVSFRGRRRWVLLRDIRPIS